MYRAINNKSLLKKTPDQIVVKNLDNINAGYSYKRKNKVEYYKRNGDCLSVILIVFSGGDEIYMKLMYIWNCGSLSTRGENSAAEHKSRYV